MASLASPTPESLAEEVAAARARARTVAAGLGAHAINWQPEGGGKWSIGQCLDHLTVTNTMYTDAIVAAIDAAEPRVHKTPLTASANTLGRWFIFTLEPPPRVRVPAPRKIHPASHLDPDDVRGRFDASLDVVLDAVARAWTIDPNRTRYRNPVARGYRVFNVTAGLQIITAHTRRHLWQAERVRARPDFPRD
jgi:hypothetical protein